MQTNQIWQTADGKLGIDGGAVYGGVLNGVVLTVDGPQGAYQVGRQVFDN